MNYGKSWENFPIEENEIWVETKTNSKILVRDLTKGIPFTESIEMVYCDSPWNLGNVNMFNGKAGREYMNSFNEFVEPFFMNIKKVNPRVVYLEIGKQELNLFTRKLMEIFPVLQKWEILYYKKFPCLLLRASRQEIKFDFTGIDDTLTPGLSIEQERPTNVIDFCTGRGLTGLAANIQGIQFFGTELNKRKLAVFIENAYKKGFKYEKSIH